MVRLVGVEGRRLLARRLFRIMVLLAFVALAVDLGKAAYDSHPPSAAQVVAAERQAAEVRRQQPPLAEQIKQCQEAKKRTNGPPAGFDCTTAFHEPVAADFLSDRTFRFATQAPSGLTGFAVVLALLGFVVGASFVGAEWSAGTMGSLLTWEPRRLRVFTAKGVAVAMWLTVVGVALMAAYLAAGYGVASWRGDTDGVTRGLLVSAGLTALRATALGAGAALGGSAVAGVLRSTSAALGLGFAYFVGAELLLRHLWAGSPPWLLTSNVGAWLLHSFTVSVSRCGPQGGCTQTVIRLSQARGAAYLGALVAGALLIWAVAFRRRDVA